MKRRSFLRCLVAGVAVSGVPATARAAVESFAQSRPLLPANAFMVEYVRLCDESPWLDKARARKVVDLMRFECIQIEAWANIRGVDFWVSDYVDLEHENNADLNILRKYVRCHEIAMKRKWEGR